MRHFQGLLIGGLIILLPSLTGCGIGYNKLLFATKTNMGIDIDTTPPAAEISIARYEGVIEPVFEDGKTLPVLASFNTDLNGFQRLLVGTSSTFAVGDAAFWMAECYTKKDQCKINEKSKDKSSILLSAPPKKRKSLFNWGEDEVEYHRPGYVAPVFFGTHSTLGLKVEWNGTAGQYPSALKIGYHRKELAWAPVTMNRVTNDSGQPITDAQGNQKVSMRAPSLLATLDNSIDVGTFDQNELSYLQYFATGEAATHLVQHPQVRKALAKQILGTDEQLETFTIRVESNRRLAEDLAEKVGALTAPDEVKLGAVYLSAINNGYIDPVKIGGSDVKSGVTHTAHHSLIHTQFKNAAMIDRPSKEETKRLNQLLTHFDS